MVGEIMVSVMICQGWHHHKLGYILKDDDRDHGHD
jgi:hypothetical protein